MNKISIVVAHHKKFFTYSNDIFLPIHVGKELSKENLNILSDNKGENISKLNPYYCEMTAMFWMWKNLDSDFYGLNHYRRYFIDKKRNFPSLNTIKFSIKKVFFKNKKSIFWENFTEFDTNLISKELDKTTNFLKLNLLDNQMIIPNKCELLNMNVQYFFSKELNVRHVDSLDSIVSENYKDFYPYFKESLNKNYLYPANIFVFEKNIFKDYCLIIFDILQKHFDTEINLKGDLNEYSRISGYMSELLTNAFIQMKISEKVKFKEYNVLYIDK